MMNKKEIRDLYLSIRKSICVSEKLNFDKSIFTHFINSSFIKKYDTFLLYISINNEVGTKDITEHLLKNNKKVAVPYCKDNEMLFYYINSFDELVEGRFGIPTVDINSSEQVVEFNDTLCIVPAISFDDKGNRLGYGGGFYDRFLSQNRICTLGLCYERCLSDSLPTENHDIKINYVLTEKCLRNHK